MMETTQLLESLRSQEVQITFTKADGSTRIMRATLQSDLLPNTNAADRSNSEPNPLVLKVWDLDKSAWRSVRVDRIQEFKL